MEASLKLFTKSAIFSMPDITITQCSHVVFVNHFLLYINQSINDLVHKLFNQFEIRKNVKAAIN